MFLIFIIRYTIYAMAIIETIDDTFKNLAWLV